MPTNLALDPQLLNDALLIGGFKSKKDTVNQALKEFIQRRRQRELISFFGSMPPDVDYDYKAGRR